MKRLLSITFALPLIALLAVGPFAGCTTQNPNAVQNPVTKTWNQPPYNPADFSTISNTASQVAGAVTAGTPYAGLAQLGIGAIFSIITGVSGWLAAKKNSGAVIDSMASAIAATGQHTAVLDHVSNNSTTSTFSAVASAIQNALTSTQSFSSPTPPKT